MIYKIRRNTAVHTAGNLPHGIKQPRPGVFIGNVQSECCGELIHAGLGILQSRQGGQLQKCGHADGQSREHSHPKQIAAEPLEALPAADLVANKHQQHKDAHEQTDVVADGEAAMIVFKEFASGVGAPDSEIEFKGCGYYGSVLDDDIATADGEIKVNGNDFEIKFKLAGDGNYTVVLNVEDNTINTTKD